jgi:iron complex transport system substrate-binding protein
MPVVRENSQASAPLFLPPVWSFGALPSANRFAALLASHLIDDEATLEGETTDGNH